MNYNVSTPDGQKHIAYLDGWRGIAILMVLAGHFAGIQHNLGFLGVNFFFALSGLLMGRILFIDKVPLRVFYRNRIARILPVFYLYIAVIFISTLYNQYEYHDGDFLYSALFLRTYFGETSIWNTPNIPISHLWSLNVEEHCYILLSLIALLAWYEGTSYPKVAVTLCALGCLACYVLFKFFPFATLSPFFLRTECAGFAILISTAIFLWLRHWHGNIHWMIPLTSGIAACVIEAMATRGPMKFIIPQILLAISVNTLAHAPAWLRNALSNRILVWFGVCSFSLYIWQQPFYKLVEYTGEPLIRVLGFAIAMIIGAVSYYCYEQPTRRWIRSIKVEDKKTRQPDAYPVVT